MVVGVVMMMLMMVVGVVMVMVMDTKQYLTMLSFTVKVTILHTATN